MLKRNYIESKVNRTTEADLPNIFIASYNRPSFDFGERVLPKFTKEALKKVHLVVREEQAQIYYETNYPLLDKGMQMIVIPQGKVSGIGSTRQYIMDYAIQHRYPVIMDIDDDITCLEYLYHGLTRGGDLTSLHSILKDWKIDPLIPQKVLQFASVIAREVFYEHPKVLLGCIRRQRYSHKPWYAGQKYIINDGETPKRVKILNVKGLYNAGIKMPAAFDKGSDAIGFAAEVIQKGYQCFTIPCLCYDCIKFETDLSELNRIYKEVFGKKDRKREYKALQKMDVHRYFRMVETYEDGTYKLGAIDWKRYNTLYGTQPHIELL